MHFLFAFIEDQAFKNGFYSFIFGMPYSYSNGIQRFFLGAQVEAYNRMSRH